MAVPTATSLVPSSGRGIYCPNWCVGNEPRIFAALYRLTNDETSNAGSPGVTGGARRVRTFEGVIGGEMNSPISHFFELSAFFQQKIERFPQGSHRQELKSGRCRLDSWAARCNDAPESEFCGLVQSNP